MTIRAESRAFRGHRAGGTRRKAVVILLPAVVAGLVPAPTAAGASVTEPVVVSGPSPFSEGCDGSTTGTVARNVEIGPQVAVNPRRPGHMVATWRQDRRLGIGPIGMVTAVSTDAGRI